LKAEGKKIEDIEYNDELAKEFTKEFKLGEVDLKASNLHEVHITKVKNISSRRRECDLFSLDAK
jgi:hypothetical protein